MPSADRDPELLLGTFLGPLHRRRVCFPVLLTRARRPLTSRQLCPCGDKPEQLATLPTLLNGQD